MPPSAAPIRPLIGITVDVAEPTPGRVRTQCSLAYAEAVVRAGGQPVLLPPITALIESQLATIDGFVLTGGDDPRTESFGERTHPKANPLHVARQDYETRLIAQLLARPEIPVFGICLGMQMLALVSGGKLDQHLPDHLPSAADHQEGRLHPVRSEGSAFLPAEGGRAAGVGGGGGGGGVASFHRQAVSHPGSMRVVARSDDGVIEAIERPAGTARFCLGVQWHPERTDDPALGDGLFVQLVRAAADWRTVRAQRAG